MKRIYIITSLLALSVYGQTFDGTGLSLAGNYGAWSRGINSLSYNPANLALPRNNAVELNFLSFNALAANNSFSINSYNRYFTEEGHHGKWSHADKKNIIDMISDDGLGVNFNVNANVLGLAFNNFAIAGQVVGQGNINLLKSKKLYEIALFGDAVDETYKFIEPSLMQGDAYSALKVSFAYAFPFSMKKLLPRNVIKYVPGLDVVSAGVALNYYVGFAAFQSRSADVMLTRIPAQGDDKESIVYNNYMEARTAVDDGSPVGKGFSMDFGLAARYAKNWYVSLSFMNMGGKINWTNNAEMVYATQRDSIVFNEDDDTDYSFDEDSTVAISSFKTPLPQKMRIAAGYRMLRNLKLMADWEQGLNTEFGNSTTPKIGVAAEYKILRWLPLRSGFSIGGKEGFQYGLGFGLNFRFFDFDISYAMKKALWPSYSRGVLFAMGMKFKI